MVRSVTAYRFRRDRLASPVGRVVCRELRCRRCGTDRLPLAQLLAHPDELSVAQVRRILMARWCTEGHLLDEPTPPSGPVSWLTPSVATCLMCGYVDRPNFFPWARWLPEDPRLYVAAGLPAETPTRLAALYR